MKKLAGNRHLLTRFGAGETSFRVNNNRFLVHMRIILDCPISRGLILYMHWLLTHYISTTRNGTTCSSSAANRMLRLNCLRCMCICIYIYDNMGVDLNLFLNRPFLDHLKDFSQIFAKPDISFFCGVTLNHFLVRWEAFNLHGSCNISLCQAFWCAKISVHN